MQVLVGFPIPLLPVSEDLADSKDNNYWKGKSLSVNTYVGFNNCELCVANCLNFTTNNYYFSYFWKGRQIKSST